MAKDKGVITLDDQRQSRKLTAVKAKEIQNKTIDYQARMIAALRMENRKLRAELAANKIPYKHLVE